MFHNSNFQSSTSAKASVPVRRPGPLGLLVSTTSQAEKVDEVRANLYATRRLKHPATSSQHFGQIDELPGYSSEAAPITLTYGFHYDDASGMGAVHIWRRHSNQLAKWGVKSVLEVPKFVAEVLKVGTPIFPARRVESRERVMAFRRGVGVVILGLAGHAGAYRWEVITGYTGHTPEGEPIGEVEWKPAPIKPKNVGVLRTGLTSTSGAFDGQARSRPA